MSNQAVNRRAEKQKIGHRRVDDDGQVTYKKRPTNEIQLAIQLGIQNAVGNETQRPYRDLLTQDFGVVEIVEFPRDGGRYTVAHSITSFTFKTYAPMAFRHFRKLYNIDISQFLASICGEELEALSNPGASGSIFYRTADDNFIIKTVQHKEAKYLQRLLLQYYLTLTQNPRTLLPKFYGLYCYQCGSKNIRFVVMNNLLPSSVRLTEKFDLKGSTYKRRAGSSERDKSIPTFKDLDFKQVHENGVFLESDIYNNLMECVGRDCLVLESFRIMDYSLLLGVYNLDQALREREASGLLLRDRHASAASAAAPSAAAPSAAAAACNASNAAAGSGQDAAPGAGGGSDGAASTAAATSDDGKPTNRTETPGLQRGLSVKRISLFNTPIESINAERASYPSEAQINEEELFSTGGIPARNSRGDRLFLFTGIIDILQSYRFFKKMEHAMKSIITDGDTVSVHNPRFYSERFQLFLKTEVFKKADASNPAKPTPAKRRIRTRASTVEADRPSSQLLGTAQGDDVTVSATELPPIVGLERRHSQQQQQQQQQQHNHKQQQQQQQQSLQQEQQPQQQHNRRSSADPSVHRDAE